jgi:hypothetical protein
VSRAAVFAALISVAVTGLAIHVAVSVVSDSSMIFWRAVDRLEYWIWYARLRIIDARYGPEPFTEANRQRNSAQ